MEAATAADLTQASEIAGQYIALGSRVMMSKGYVSGLTVAPGRHALPSHGYSMAKCSHGPPRPCMSLTMPSVD